jgi:hypothetical protein
MSSQCRPQVQKDLSLYHLIHMHSHTVMRHYYVKYGPHLSTSTVSTVLNSIVVRTFSCSRSVPSNLNTLLANQWTSFEVSTSFRR